MAQKEKQAKYAGMPGSVIDTGLVDHIRTVEKMPAELIRYVLHPYIAGVKKTYKGTAKLENHLHKIFLLIRGATGHDFSNYKTNTIRRRIERRMAVHQIDKIASYVRYLRQSPIEAETLSKDLLITVTNFFRDPDAFDVLAKKVIPDLVKGKENDSSIRVWVTGCATGEEAYSIAILLVEVMEKYKKHLNVQIFATDIDMGAIESTRTAVYPESIAADVSSKRLKRFLIKDENTYKVTKQLREMVVFAEQNLIKGPPFSNLDMVNCRNLLIYMNTVLQKKVLPLFHYTLKRDGILFLGSSESIGQFADSFTPIDAKWKIFRRKGAVRPKSMELPQVPFEIASKEIGTGGVTKEPSGANFKELAEKIILDSYSPTCVLVNEKYDIVYFHGKTERFLSVPAGVPRLNILKMAHEGLAYKLNLALHKA